MTRRFGIWLRSFPVWFWFLVGAVGICAFTVGLIVSSGPRDQAPTAGSDITPAAPTATVTKSVAPPTQRPTQAPVTTPPPTRPTATVTAPPVTTTPSVPPPSRSAGTPTPNLPSGLASALGGLLGLDRSPRGLPASGTGINLLPSQK